MNDRRTQLLFRAAPGSQRPGSGHGYIITGSNGWTVTGVVRINGTAKNLTARAGWGPTEDYKTLTVPLNRVDAGGVWNLSGRGIGPAPGVLWITLDEKPLLTAGAVSAQSWRQQATERAFPGPKKTAAPARTAPQAEVKSPAAVAGPVKKQESGNGPIILGPPAVQAAAGETQRADDKFLSKPEEPEKVTAEKTLKLQGEEGEEVHTMEGPPLARRQEAAALTPEPDTAAAAQPETDGPPPPLPAAAAPETILELMQRYPEETPFIGLLPGAKFVRVPVTGGTESYDHYIVGHIPIGQKGFYLVGVPGPAGWQAPAGLPQFMHYLPGRLGGGYWVRYMVPDGSWQ